MSGESGPIPKAVEHQHDIPETLAAKLGFAETADMRELRSAIVRASLNRDRGEVVNLRYRYQTQAEQLVDGAENSARASLAKLLVEATIAHDSASSHYVEELEASIHYGIPAF